jgi:hypothetical protein
VSSVQVPGFEDSSPAVTDTRITVQKHGRDGTTSIWGDFNFDERSPLLASPSVRGCVLVGCEDAQTGPSLQIPDPHGRITAQRHSALPIWCNRRALNPGRSESVPADSGFQVPRSQSLIVFARGDC